MTTEAKGINENKNDVEEREGNNMLKATSRRTKVVHGDKSLSKVTQFEFTKTPYRVCNRPISL